MNGRQGQGSGRIEKKANSAEREPRAAYRRPGLLDLHGTPLQDLPGQVAHRSVLHGSAPV